MSFYSPPEYINFGDRPDGSSHISRRRYHRAEVLTEQTTNDWGDPCFEREQIFLDFESGIVVTDVVQFEEWLHRNDLV